MNINSPFTKRVVSAVSGVPRKNPPVKVKKEVGGSERGRSQAEDTACEGDTGIGTQATHSVPSYRDKPPPCLPRSLRLVRVMPLKI